MTKNKKGFTLIELIVVMIIIGILVLLASPRFIRYIRQARYTNIVHDIKVTESVLTAHIARTSKGLSSKVNTMPENSKIGDLTGIGDKVAYVKEGLLELDGIEEEYFIRRVNEDDVGYIATISAKSLEKIEPFYILDKKWIKSETRTRLPGNFLGNEDGLVIYTDADIAEKEIIDETEFINYELFTYDDITNQPGVITGFSEKGIKYVEDNNFEFPEIPKKRKFNPDLDVIIGDMKEAQIKEWLDEYYWDSEDYLYKLIEEESWANYIRNKSEKIFNELVEEHDKYIEITTIGSNAFKKYDYEFTNDFNAPYLLYIENNAFSSTWTRLNFNRDKVTLNEKGSKFIGKLNAKNLISIGNHAFSISEFKGELDLPNVESIGSNAFGYYKRDTVSNKPVDTVVGSNFIGDFNLPKINSIGDQAFVNSRFTGEFNGPEVITIGKEAFGYGGVQGSGNNADSFEPKGSKFAGEFKAPKIQTVGSSAFINSKFTGNFDLAEVTEIGGRAFPYSNFIGDFNAPELLTVGKQAFGYRYQLNFTDHVGGSEFEGTLNAPKLQIVGGSGFYKSNFTGEFNVPDISSVGFEAFYNSTFTGNFDAKNLVTVNGSAFSNSVFTGEFNSPKVKTIGSYAFLKSKFTGKLITGPNASIGYGAFQNSDFTN